MISDTLHCPPPASARDPAFIQGLDTSAMTALVQERLADGAEVIRLTPDYVRWKDGDGSLIGYRVVLRAAGAETSTYVTARSASPQRLAGEVARIRHRADEMHAGLRLYSWRPGDDLLLLAFPLDRAMPDLRNLVRASKMRTLLNDQCPAMLPPGCRISKHQSRWELVRYKPERRAVLRWDMGVVDGQGRERGIEPIWLRCYEGAFAPRASIAAGFAVAGGVCCPGTRAVPHDRLLLETHLAGSAWEPSDANATEAAGETLARLHAIPPPRSLPVHGPIAELDLVLSAVEDLGRLQPALGRQATEIANALTRTVPSTSPTVFAHGDFHRGQVLVDEFGAGLCDFDRACAAPAATDLATFHAHCVEADPDHGPTEADAFFSAYARHLPLPPPAELAWWTGCSLLRAAMTPFRSLRPGWPGDATRLLVSADRAARKVHPVSVP